MGLDQGVVNVNELAQETGGSLDNIETYLLNINTLLVKYSLIMDKTSTTNITYVGKAVIGSTTDQALWQIFTIDKTSSFEIKWADANSNFDNIWDNRISLSYSL